MLEHVVKPDRMYMVFHKGNTKTFLDRVVTRAIKIFTYKDYRKGKKKGYNKTQFSHTELIFPQEIAGYDNSFSSRGSSKPTGVHFKHIKKQREC